MTMPIERTRAVLETEQFLIQLKNGDWNRKDKDIRTRAYQLLRHFPTTVDLQRSAMKVPELWEIPLDYI